MVLLPQKVRKNLCIKKRKHIGFSNEPLTDAVWRMTLAGDTQWITAQTVRQYRAGGAGICAVPISVCDFDDRSRSP